MPQYLLSVWFDEPYDDVDSLAPETQRLMAQTAELNAEMGAPAPGCSSPVCGRRRRRPWCEPWAATSR